jgi:hypothetical protein
MLKITANRAAPGAPIVPNPQRVDSQRRVKINPTQ